MGRLGMGDFERAVLLAIMHLRGEGYAVSSGDEIERRTGRRVSLGAIYATVDRLEKKGFVTSTLGEATEERGGKRKRLYKILAPGRRALNDAMVIAEKMWAPIPRGARA